MDQLDIDNHQWGEESQLSAEKFDQLLGFHYITENIVTSPRVQNVLEEIVQELYGNVRNTPCRCTLPPNRTKKCNLFNKCINLSKFRECPADCGEGCTNQPFRNNEWKSKLNLVHREGRGMGIVTQEPIAKNEFIEEFVGQVFLDLENPHRNSNYAIQIRRLFDEESDQSLVIEPTTHGNIIRFLAHSCKPNCEAYTYLSGDSIHVVIMACKNISPGTELTFHYGRDFKKLGIKKCLCDHCKIEELKIYTDKLASSLRTKLSRTGYFSSDRAKATKKTKKIEENLELENIDEQRPGTSRANCPEVYQRGEPRQTRSQQNGKQNELAERQTPTGPVKRKRQTSDHSNNERQNISSVDESSEEYSFTQACKFKKTAKLSLENMTPSKAPKKKSPVPRITINVNNPTIEFSSDKPPRADDRLVLELIKGLPQLVLPRYVTPIRPQLPPPPSIAPMPFTPKTAPPYQIRHPKLFLTRCDQGTKPGNAPSRPPSVPPPQPFLQPPDESTRRQPPKEAGPRVLPSCALQALQRPSTVSRQAARRGRPRTRPPSPPEPKTPAKRGRPKKDPERLQCDYCPMSFNHLGHLENHRNALHIRDRRFVCEECGDRFNTQNVLDQHRKLHLPDEETTWFHCSKCGDRFRRRGDVRTHQGGKLSKCKKGETVVVKPGQVYRGPNRRQDASSSSSDED